MTVRKTYRPNGWYTLIFPIHQLRRAWKLRAQTGIWMQLCVIVTAFKMDKNTAATKPITTVEESVLWSKSEVQKKCLSPAFSPGKLPKLNWVVDDALTLLHLRYFLYFLLCGGTMFYRRFRMTHAVNYIILSFVVDEEEYFNKGSHCIRRTQMSSCVIVPATLLIFAHGSSSAVEEYNAMSTGTDSEPHAWLRTAVFDNPSPSYWQILWILVASLCLCSCKNVTLNLYVIVTPAIWSDGETAHWRDTVSPKQSR